MRQIYIYIYIYIFILNSIWQVVTSSNGLLLKLLFCLLIIVYNNLLFKIYCKIMVKTCQRISFLENILYAIMQCCGCGASERWC